MTRITTGSQSFYLPYLSLPLWAADEGVIFRFLWLENSVEHSEGAETEDPGYTGLANPIATNVMEAASRCSISRAPRGFLEL